MSAIAAGFLGQRRIVMVLVLAVAAFALFLPVKQMIQQRDRIGVLEDKLTELRSENAMLEEDVERLTDPKELEVLARERLGLVKEGERAYFIEPTKPEPTAAPKKAPEASWWDRGWEWFSALIRGGD